MFLQLVTRYFSRSNKLHRNFNQNTVKASYSSMNNVSKIIKGHDKKVTSKPRDQTPKCNCREKAECPMKGNCQVAHIIIKTWSNKTLTKKSLSWTCRGRTVSITASYHSNTRDIPIRQYFQITCGTWKCSKWNT